MSLLGHYFLSLDNCVTYGAVAAFGKTCLFAGCCYCLVNYYSMTCCRNYLLSLDNALTYGAVTSFGKTCLGTCSRYCGIDYYSVSLFRHYFLSLDDLTAYGAVAALGKTCFFTCCSYSLVDNNSVCMNSDRLCGGLCGCSCRHNHGGTAEYYLGNQIVKHILTCLKGTLANNIYRTVFGELI